MSLFVIADLHLSFGCNKPMDVFPGWKDYTQRLEQNWRSLVKESDTVVIAGDISWAMKLETEQDFAFIHRLPGQKILMKGNHDYWWSTKSKIERFLQEKGFTSMKVLHNNAYIVENVAVCGTRGWLYNSETEEDVKIVNREVGRLVASLDDAVRQDAHAQPIVFLHYPPVYGNMACAGILDVLETRHIEQCYFGHIHGNQASKKAVRGNYHGIKMHLISCDYVNFMPILVK